MIRRLLPMNNATINNVIIINENLLIDFESGDPYLFIYFFDHYYLNLMSILVCFYVEACKMDSFYVLNNNNDNL